MVVVPTFDPPTSPRTHVDAAVEAGRAAATPFEVNAGEVYLVHTRDGVKVVDLDTNEYRRRTMGRPERKTGAVDLDEADSFTAYVNAHAEPDRCHLFADRLTSSVTAVLNGHRQGHHHPDPETDEDPGGWGDHQARLGLVHTPEWVRWTAGSGRWMGQADFAEHLEEGSPEIVEPTAAEMLELASTIEATKGVDVKSSTRLDNGQVRIRYEETVKTRAGATGQLDYPTRLTLGIRPFRGSDHYRLTARLRHRIEGAGLRLSYVLDRPEDVEDAAFGDVTAAIGAATGLDVLHGRP